MAGTRRYVKERASVEISGDLDAAIQRLVRDVAGDVVDAVESIATQIVKETREQWYTLVSERSGRSGDGTDYRLEIKGDTIRAVVFNHAKQFAKRSTNVDFQGNLLPGETKKSEQKRATEEYYAYFVHAPSALSMTTRAVPLAEYRELMRYFRRTGALPPNYVARAYRDRLGRRRPVGIGKIIRNPKAGDGKGVWQTLVVKGHKRIVDEQALTLDRALTASGKKLAKR
jgi:hypothetical protein